MDLWFFPQKTFNFHFRDCLTAFYWISGKFVFAKMLSQEDRGEGGNKKIGLLGKPKGWPSSHIIKHYCSIMHSLDKCWTLTSLNDLLYQRPHLHGCLDVSRRGSRVSGDPWLSPKSSEWVWDLVSIDEYWNLPVLLLYCLPTLHENKMWVSPPHYRMVTVPRKLQAGHTASLNFVTLCIT